MSRTPDPAGVVYRVDASTAENVLVGDHGVLNVYNYNQTWYDAATPPALRNVSGRVESPYRGLSAFTEHDSGFFFGRQKATAEVLQVISEQSRTPGIVVISGVSGAGKSSLLQAGVLPVLRARGLASVPGSASWPCVVFTPGPEPLRNLAVRTGPLAGVDPSSALDSLRARPERFALTAQAAALNARRDSQPGPQRQPGGALDAENQRLLIVVDQFEQLFTVCKDAGERQDFVTALHSAATSSAAISGPDDGQQPAAVVVLVVRADFETRLADFPELTEAVKGRYLLTAMNRTELRVAISEPAALVKSGVDESLVTAILEEVRPQDRTSPTEESGLAMRAGMLPLVSYALDRAWRSRQGATLTPSDYERSGGIAGAVRGNAESAYDDLTPAQQALARQIFIRLTATSGDGTVTAARVTRGDLDGLRGEASTDDVQAVLQGFASVGLLTLAAGTVEMSHEILLTAWPLLRDVWLEETREDRATRTRLQQNASEWVANHREPSYLYRKHVLQKAAETASRAQQDPARYTALSQDEEEFLGASTRADRRGARVRRGITGLLVVLVLASVSAAVAATRSSREAEHSSRVSMAGQFSAQSELFGESNPIAARMESLAAWNADPTAASRYAMLKAAALPGITELGTSDASSYEAGGLEFSPDGKYLAVGGFTANDNDAADYYVQVLSLSTLQPVSGQIAGYSAVFEPHSDVLAIGEANNNVRLWNVISRRWTGPMFRGAGEPAAFIGNGTTLATLTESAVQLWNVATGQQDGSPISNFGAYTPDTVASNGDLVTTDNGESKTTFRVYNIPSGRWTGPYVAGCPTAEGDVSPDGSILVTACAASGLGRGVGTGAITFFSLASGAQIGAPITSIDAPVSSVAFSPDGSLLAVASGGSNGYGGVGGGTFLFSAATHQQIGNPVSGDGPIGAIAFSPDGSVLASGTFSGITLSDTEMATGDPAGPAITSPGPVSDIAYSPDGRVLGISSGTPVATAGAVQLITDGGGPRNGRRVTVPFPGTPVAKLAFSPDGATVAAGTSSLMNPETVQLINTSTGREIGSPISTPSSLDGGVTPVAFSPSGTVLAIGGTAGTELWNVTTHAQIGPVLPSEADVYSEEFSPNGKILAVGAGDEATGGIVQLWNTGTRKLIANIYTQDTVYSAAFSPDGDLLATASESGGVQLWNISDPSKIGPGSTLGTGQAVSAAFSPDGQTLAVDDYTSTGSSETSSIQLFDLADNNQAIGAPFTTGGFVETLAFSPDGQTLAAGGTINGNGATQLYNVSYLKDPVQFLCAADGQYFTRAAWQTFANDLPYSNVCP